MKLLAPFALLVALLTAGCDVLVPAPSRDPDAVLHVENRGGPDLVLVVAAIPFDVPCGATFTLAPGDARLPGLPWPVEVRKASTGELVLVDQVTELPRSLLQMDGDPPRLSDTFAYGPSTPCPSPSWQPPR